MIEDLKKLKANISLFELLKIPIIQQKIQWHIAKDYN